MAKLRLGGIDSDKSLKLTIELQASVHRDLLAYAAAHAHETGQQKRLEVSKLIAPLLERFMTTDRAFARARREVYSSQKVSDT